VLLLLPCGVAPDTQKSGVLLVPCGGPQTPRRAGVHGFCSGFLGQHTHAMCGVPPWPGGQVWHAWAAVVARVLSICCLLQRGCCAEGCVPHRHPLPTGPGYGGQCTAAAWCVVHFYSHCNLAVTRPHSTPEHLALAGLSCIVFVCVQGGTAPLFCFCCGLLPNYQTATILLLHE
jgi:hypothetical protein